MWHLLESHNPHWQQESLLSTDYRPRPEYERTLMLLSQNTPLLVLKGLRGTGKTTLLRWLIQELQNKNFNPQNIFYLNLEDLRLGLHKTAPLLKKLWELYLKEQQPKGPVMFILDEIQSVPEVGAWALKILKERPSLRIIFSCSSELPQEPFHLKTQNQLRTLTLLPLSFSEFLSWSAPQLFNEVKALDFHDMAVSPLSEEIIPIFRSFLFRGGFPSTVFLNSEINWHGKLQQILDAIVYRDVVQRYGLRKIQSLQNLIYFSLTGAGTEVRLAPLAQKLNLNRLTVINLMDKLQRTGLINRIGPFSFYQAERESPRKRKKLYIADNGLYSILKTDRTLDLGRRAENVLFLFLHQQWNQNVYYWKGKENVDFVNENGVPFNLFLSNQISQRKLRALFYFLHHYNLERGYLFSLNLIKKVEENGKTIFVLPLWAVLLHSSELLEHLPDLF